MPETIRTPIFQRYEGLTKIGSGSMGAVYKAQDLRLDRQVALKVLPPGLREDAEALERFRREARTLALLKHPGVASVYDAEVQGDFPYLVMEFVEGENLEKVLQRQGPLPVDEVVRLGIEIAEALEHIHCHRIVHRDIKAANIIIGPQGRAVLVDFGVAFLGSLPRISQGSTLGTPEYMSPEQADGRPMDGRSDLYSVGVVLFECLTGDVPFKRESEGLAGLADMLKQIMEAPVPPVRAQCPDVPAWLDEVIQRCLSKLPEDRYTSAADLAVALRKDRYAREQAEERAQALVSNPERLPLTHQAPPAVAADAGVSQTSEAAQAVPAVRQGPSGLVISHLESVDAVTFSPNGRRFASASKDGGIRVWSANDGHLVHLLKGHTALSVSFSKGGSRLASGGVDGAICVWDVDKEQPTHRLEAHQGYVLAVAYSRDGKLLASGGIDGAVRVWKSKTGRLERTLGWQYGYVLSVSFSPDGRRLASGGADGAVRLWDVNTGEVQAKLQGHAGYVASVAFSPDGKRLASGSADGTIRLWEVSTGRLVQTFQGHADWVTSVAFSPDGRRLTSGSRDRTVRLWDTSNGQMLRRFKGHAAAVTSVAFSPDGTRLASGSSDHTVRLWTLDVKDLVRKVPRRTMLAACIMIGFAAVFYWRDHIPPVSVPDVDWAGLKEQVEGWIPDEPEPSVAEETPPAQTNNRPRRTAEPPPARPQPASQQRTPPPVTADDRTAGDETVSGGLSLQELLDAVRDEALTEQSERVAEGERGARLEALPSAQERDTNLYSASGLAPTIGSWTLIVDTQPTRLQAERVARTYRAQGYRVGVLRVLFRGRLSYRVGVGQFETQAAASRWRRQLAGEELPYDTWLMRIQADD